MNGYPEIVCTEELNAIMSLSDHWEIAVEIPIDFNPETIGIAQTINLGVLDSAPSQDAVYKAINQFVSAVGTFHYADLATQTTPISVTSGVETLLTNDALGAYTNISNAPYGVPTVYNADTNEFDFSSLSVGDIIHFRPDLNIDLTGTNTSYELYLKGSIGTAKEWVLDLTSGGERKSTAEFHKNGFMGFDIAFEEMTTAPSQLFIKTDANATVKVNGWYIEVLRKNINVVNIAFDGIIETKRFTPTGQVCTLPTGAVAVNAHIDGYIQYPEQAGFESDLNTFTQSGDEVTFNTTFDGTPQILITYNL